MSYDDAKCRIISVANVARAPRPFAPFSGPEPLVTRKAGKPSEVSKFVRGHSLSRAASMSWLAQAAANAEARLTEALNKVDSAAAPALEKAKDRLEETKAQIAEKASALGLGAGGDLRQTRGEGSGAGGARAIEAAPVARAEPKASSDAPIGTVGDDAGRVDAVPEIVPEIVPPPSAPREPASAEPPAKKKTQLELLRERRLAREAAAANAKGIVAGLVPDPPTEGTRSGPAERIPRAESDHTSAPPPAEHPSKEHPSKEHPSKEPAEETAVELATGNSPPEPEPGVTPRTNRRNRRDEGGTPAFAAARERADADLELERRVKRVALLAHAGALRTRRAEETRDAEARADRAVAAREARASSSSRATEAYAARAQKASAALESERLEHERTREDAEERVAALAGAGGTRAKALATEQRRLAEVTARRDDAAEEVERLRRDERELRRRIVAANRRRERAKGALAERKKGASISHEAEAAALEESLRRLRVVNDAAAARIASPSDASSGGSGRSGVPDVSAEDATDQLRLDVAFRTATEALIAEQTRAEALAAARSALVFRLEQATRNADENDRLGSYGFADEEAGMSAVESAAAGYRYGHNNAGVDDDDDVIIAGLAETGRYAPKQLAYDIASKALGGGERARRVSNLAGAVDALVMEGLRAVSRHGGARAAAVAYTCVLHLYMFALLFFGGSGPRATSTATMTAESLYPKP